MTHLEGHSLYLVLLPHSKVETGFIQPRHLLVLQDEFHFIIKTKSHEQSLVMRLGWNFNYNSISDLTQ